jgi:predicted nucleic acid-binding protein
MVVLVDTNVIADVLHDDPRWRAWSEQQLAVHVGTLAINPFIYAELCCRVGSPAELDAILEVLGIGYEEVPKEALFLAAQAFLLYRSRGGAKSAPLPDFFIGAHASAGCFSLITRDAARYQTYFPSVRLICP